MSELRFVKPSKDMQSEILRYKYEFIESGDSIDGSAGLGKIDNFDSWLISIELNSSERTVMKGFVPSTTYVVLRNTDNKLIGMVDIRHRLNDVLKMFGGHIGYSVRNSERRKGYAKEILRLALKECKDMDINKVLVTCNKENVASARTIISNGGILEDEIIIDDKLIQRYWIDI